MRAPVATLWASAQSTMAGPSATPSGAAGERSVLPAEESALAERSVLAVVLLAFFVDGLGHAADEAVRHPVLAAVGDDLAQLGFEFGGAAAGPTPVEVDPDLRAPLLRQFAVEIVVQNVDRFLAVDGRAEEPVRTHGAAVLALCHVLAHSIDPPGRLPTRPRASATSCNAFCSALLPRWILLMTVPMGTAVISEISL